VSRLCGKTYLKLVVVENSAFTVEITISQHVWMLPVSVYVWCHV